MFPKDVSHEGRRSGQKWLFAESAHVFASHREVGLIDPFQTELPDRPIEPMGNVQLWPLTGICAKDKAKNNVSKGGIPVPYTYYVNNSRAHL